MEWRFRIPVGISSETEAWERVYEKGSLYSAMLLLPVKSNFTSHLMYCAYFYNFKNSCGHANFFAFRTDPEKIFLWKLNTEAVTNLTWSWLNLHTTFILIKSWSILNLGHSRSETRSLVQINDKPCLHSMGLTFGQILLRRCTFMKARSSLKQGQKLCY